jgi:Icc-related predicted phosphoesterase
MKIKRISDATARNFRMRLCHISDTHGNLPRLYGRWDACIHTGDFFPNSHHVIQADKTREMEFQLQWLRDNEANFKGWLQGHPFLYVLGNHDFLHPELMEQELNSMGIRAIDLTNKLVTFQGINFYGFPYVPSIDGTWNFEKHLPEMQIEVDKMVEVLNQNYVDVLACHAPLYGMLDLTIGNEVIGSTVLANAMDYKISREMVPQIYLCGHVHEANGIANRNGVLISNAATARHLVEVM